MEILQVYWRYAALAAWGLILGGVFLVVGQELAALAALSSIVVALILLQRPQRPRPRVRFEHTNEVDFFCMSRARQSILRLVRGEDSVGQGAPDAAASAAERYAFSIGRSRPVDVEAIVENEVEALRSCVARPKAISMMMGRLQPTGTQLERYQDEVSAYGESLRAWLEDAEPILRNRAIELELAPALTNDAPVDALGGHVQVLFPKEFAPADQDAELLDPPTPPNPPVGKPMSSLFDISPLADRQRVDFSVPLHALRPQLVTAQPRDEVRFSRLEDGRLVASYKRRTIRHRETDADAPALSVTCPEPGRYTAEWFIHAENLPKPAQGTLEIDVRPGEYGDPIESLHDLLETLDLNEEDDFGD